jgi:hypothetical protein
MNSWRILYHMMRADFFERTRRYSFLAMLLACVMLGYWVNNGTIALLLGGYRGIYNSAWVGSLMAVVTVSFVGWFGFYLVKNTVERDERTGVGQIIATTPLSRIEYALGKWLSNFVVLAALCMILLLAAVVMQLFQREDPVFNLWALAAPLLFVALPFMALIAAFAIFFEAVPWLRGGLGNVVYFFLFIALMVFAITSFGQAYPQLEPFGIRLFSNDMAAALQQVYPNHDPENFTLGASDTPVQGTFYWSGLHWTPGLIAIRLSWIAISAAFAALAGLIFNRFDTPAASVGGGSRLGRLFSRPGGSAAARVGEPAALAAVPTPRQLSPLGEWSYRPRFGRLLLAELRLLLKGQRWYWYAGVLLIALGTFLAPPEELRQGWLVAAAIWPVFIWSQLGMRENRWRAEQLVFSAPRPLWLLLASWLGGVVLSGLITSGAVVRWLIIGDTPGLLAWVGFILFVPSLALLLGVLSGSSKLFEVVYLVLWYLGPLNRLPELDFTGVLPEGLARSNPLLLAAAGLGLLAAAVFSRQMRLRVK